MGFKGRSAETGEKGSVATASDAWPNRGAVGGGLEGGAEVEVWLYT